MELENGLKDVFYDKSSSAASSDARIPLLNNDGTPKGSDTAIKISSLLSGIVTNQRNEGAYEFQPLLEGNTRSTILLCVSQHSLWGLCVSIVLYDAHFQRWRDYRIIQTGTLATTFKKRDTSLYFMEYKMGWGLISTAFVLQGEGSFIPISQYPEDAVDIVPE